MNCGCKNLNNDGQKIVDLVRGKGFENNKPSGDIIITCECGNEFKMNTLICKCANCCMTFAVTPCSSSSINNVAKAGINY